MKIELWPIDRPIAYARNARKISDIAVDKVAASIKEFGFRQPIVVDAQDVIVAGHTRLLAAKRLCLTEVPVHVADNLTPAQVKAYRLMDNRSHQESEWDFDLLGPELEELEGMDFDLELTGFDADEIADLLTPEIAEGPTEEEAVPEPPAQPVTMPGDVWLIGKHRLICGDCRDAAVVEKLMAGASVNVAITSPPYATQREYDPTSGFKPIPPDEYVEWFRAVAAGVESVLAPDGSYLLNIKAHADEGERDLYVMDLVMAHRRQWGWRFVDEFCWRKSDNGVPGGWQNRFKNAWEPVFHFCRQQEIKFRAEAVSHASDDCFDYSPDNPKATSGSGLLGTGPRGQAAGQPGAEDGAGRHSGLARPSNVIECKTESSQGSHSAPFPRALVEFFIKAFSDAGDIIFDCFMGSGTTMAAAHVLGRTGYGCEISPGYCDVIVRRMMNLGIDAMLESNGDSFADVAAQRGVDPEQALNPKAQDSGAIKHRGPNPHYGSRARKAS